MRLFAWDAVSSLWGIFQRSWLVRWTLANIAGWSTGLMAAALLVQQFGPAGMAIAGTVIGSIVGVMQALAFRTHPAWRPDLRAWILRSTAGGALATFPAYLSGFVLLLNFNLGLLLMGMIFGGCLGLMQAALFDRDFDGVGWWVLACLAAGAICAPLSLSASSVWLPVCCSPGPLLFGLITGGMFLRKVMYDE